MANRLDLEGKVIGMWTILSPAPRPFGTKQLGTWWLARCGCGALQVHNGGKLNAGRGTRGCEKCRSHRGSAGGQTPEYQSWRGMRERCLNRNHQSWENYGGKGITVCDRWVHSFKNFLDDMGKRPRGTSLDRIDNCEGYSPDNCRWASVGVQARNKSSFVMTDEQKAAAILLYKQGATAVDLAMLAGVSRSHIACIVADADNG